MSTRAKRHQRALRFETLENRGLLAAVVPGFDSNLLPAQDDSPSAAVSLPFAINFYGQRFDSLWVNNNGNVTFNGSLSQYVPFGLSTNIGTRIIAPFFADVDTGDSDDPLGTVTYDVGTFEGRPAFGVTYTDVGYFDTHGDLRNSFQIILVDRSDIGSGPNGNDFDIVFNYDQIQWDTGDLSRNVSAVAGFSDGTGRPNTFFQISGSLANGAFYDANRVTGLVYGSRGSDVPGRYVFAIRGGQFDAPPTRQRFDGPIILPRASTPPAPVVDPEPADVSGRTTEFSQRMEITPVELSIPAVRTIYGTGYSDRLPQPTSAVADHAEQNHVLPTRLPLVPAVAEQLLIREHAEDPMVSLLAALPMEHEEIALNTQLASISGQVWHDADGDGRVDLLEQRLTNRSVFVDLNGNGEIDSGEPIATTDPLGGYRIEDLDLKNGEYLVRVAKFDLADQSTGASEAQQVRIDRQKPNVSEVNFGFAVPVSDELAAHPTVDTPRWPAWLLGTAATAAIGAAWLLNRAWRRKRDSAYAVWHVRVAAGDSNPTQRGTTLTALEDTVCETEERNVSKNAR